MCIPGAVIELKSSLRIVNSFPIEAEWSLVSAHQLQQLKTNLSQALRHLRDKPKSTCGSSPVSRPAKRIRLSPVEPTDPGASIKVEAVPIKVEEAVDIWDQPSLDAPDPLDHSPLWDPVDDPPSPSFPTLIVPTRQTLMKAESNPYLKVSPELRCLLLELNAQPLCHRAQDPPWSPDFQVLKGQGPEHYGLYPTKIWRHHLTFLLLKLPHFRHNHYIFFASIFKQSVFNWRTKLPALKCMVQGDVASAYQASFSIKDAKFVSNVQTPISEDKVDYGLSPCDWKDLRRLEEEVNAESSQVDSKLTLSLPGGEEAGGKPPEIEPGVFDVEMLKTFGTLQFYAYKRCILPVMKTEGCIGLMGLARTGESSLKGRMLVRLGQSPLSNPGEELSNLSNVISQVFGLPRLAIFKWQEMVPEGEGKMYTEYWSKGKRDSMASKDNQPKVDAGIESIRGYEQHANHVEIQELTFYFKHMMKLELLEDLPLTEIKNLALVMRIGHSDKFGLKPLLVQDCMDRFLAQDRVCPKISKRLSHPQFCRTLLEIFKCLTKVKSKEMVQRFPAFGEEFRKVRSLWNLVKNVGPCSASDSQKTQLVLGKSTPKARIKFKCSPKASIKSQTGQIKQCEYCGKTFTCFTVDHNTALACHVRKCKLEKSTCACAIAFSSPREKRSHMLLKHSDGNYLKCAQCLYLTQDQKVLDNHVEYFHGFPGREEICNLCQKSFRCKNHLSHHHFTHESHYCTPCGQEFVGRLPFRRHMKTEHGAGFPCELCGKVILTKNELGKHMKLKHFNTTWKH